VLVDFDDTAAEQNVAQMLLERFGDPTWQAVRERFRQGELTLKEYQEITFSNILAASPQVNRATMQDYVKQHANLRPYFKELWEYCQAEHIPMAIVSVGLDFYIEALLDRVLESRVLESRVLESKEGHTGMPVHAVNTSFTSPYPGVQEISYTYEHTRPGHERQGISKGLVVDQYRNKGHYIFYAGDGQSDLEAAAKADLLYAHRTLADECTRLNIPFHPFTDFQDMYLAVREYQGNRLRSRNPGRPCPEVIGPWREEVKRTPNDRALLPASHETGLVG
jgi:2-hydroxy-3-keto-5-methylthiopentenyl-1-phosphate phosphatase